MAARALVLLIGMAFVVTPSALFASDAFPSPAVTPEVSQRYCGLYCVYGALRLHDVNVQFSSLLRPEFLGSPQGSSALELKGALEANGVYAQVMRDLTPASLRKYAKPVILHVKATPEDTEATHFILYRGELAGSAVIFDPPRQARVMSYSSLAPIWNGVGVVVSREPMRRWEAAHLIPLPLALVVTMIFGLAVTMRTRLFTRICAERALAGDQASQSVWL